MRSSGRLRSILVVGIVIGMVAAAVFFKNDPGDQGRRHAGSGTGFRGVIAAGVGLLIQGSKSNEGVWTVQSSEDLRNPRLRVVMRIDEETCDVAPHLPCIQRDQAVLSFRISALLNFKDLIKINDRDSEDMRFQGKEPATGEGNFPLGLPFLPTGLHCLTVAALEDPYDVIGRSLPSHGTVTTFAIAVGKRKPNHCKFPELIKKRLTKVPKNPEYDFGCGFPLISVERNKPRRQGQVGRKQPLWLHVPQCGTRMTILFIHNGVFQAEKDFMPPFSVMTSGVSEPQYVMPLSLLPGTWLVVGVAGNLVPPGTLAAEKPLIITS